MIRRVLVTGANSGIGAATAVELARVGFEVIGSARDHEGVEALRRHALQAGVAVEAITLDLEDPEAAAKPLADMDLWALVNNAGYTNAGAVEDITVEEGRRQLEVMTLTPMALSLAALPAMRRRGDGRIVNVTSIGVGSGVPLLGWYQAAKNALEGLTDALRNEVVSDGIAVVSVQPAGIDTPIWDRAHHELDSRFRGSVHRAAYTRAMTLITTLRPWMRSPDIVAQTIRTALTVGEPRPTYKVGVDGKILDTMNRLVPRSVKDGIERTLLRS